MAKTIAELQALTNEAFEALGNFRRKIYGSPIYRASKQEELHEDQLRATWSHLKFELDLLLEKEEEKKLKEENKRLREEKARIKAELKLNPPIKVPKVKVVKPKAEKSKVEKPVIIKKQEVKVPVKKPRRLFGAAYVEPKKMVKKTVVVKKATPAKKTVVVKKATPTKNTVVVKNATPTKKTVVVKKTTSAKKTVTKTVTN